MSDNIDVVKELEKKNKEIYLNKLYIDVDNNREIVIITINNMFDLLEKELIDKVVEIQGGILSFDEIMKIVHPFEQELNSNLANLVKKRSIELKDYIIKNDQIDYDAKLKKENDVIVVKITKFYQNNIDVVINKLKINLSAFSQTRLTDYLKILYFEKLINKINEILDNTNRILYNNYLDGVSKYERMNNKTLNHA